MSNMIAGFHMKTNDGSKVYMSLNNDMIKCFEDEIKVIMFLGDVANNIAKPKDFERMMKYFNCTN